MAQSILKANAGVPLEEISPAVASALADEVFTRVTKQYEIISTADVRECVGGLLREKGYYETAKSYMEYQK